MSSLEKSRIVINEQGQACDGYGFRYESLNNDEIDKFCSRFRDKDILNMGLIYEKDISKESIKVGIFPLLSEDATKQIFGDMIK